MTIFKGLVGHKDLVPNNDYHPYGLTVWKSFVQEK
jgi:hypothetical protein